MDSEEELQVLEEIREKGKDSLGVYHSHPKSLQPSDQDIEEAYWEDHIYLIASIEKKEVKVWRWTGQEFEEEELKII